MSEADELYFRMMRQAERITELAATLAQTLDALESVLDGGAMPEATARATLRIGRAVFSMNEVLDKPGETE